MSEFDVAIGLTQDELDAISLSLYQQVYPQLFTGSQEATVGGIEYTVTWDIKAPATFDLSDPSAAKAALRAHLGSLRDPQAGAPTAEQLDAVEANAAAFSFTYATVDLTLSAPDVAPAELSIALSATAHMAVTGNQQSMSIDAMSTPRQPDPVQDWLVQNIVVPKMLAASHQIFGGVSIPAIQLPGLTLGPPVPFVTSNTLIAIANVAGEPTPAVPAAGSVSWPSSQFFTLISQNAFQLLTGKYVADSQNSRSGSGSNGSHWAGDDWSYSLGIGNPHVTLHGDASIELTADVQGSVSASVYIVHIPIGVGFTALAEPGLSATLGLEVDGSSLVVKTRSVSPFVLVVEPSGSIPAKITGAMIEPIIQAVVAAFSPFISSFLGGIEFASFTIPTYSVTVSGISLTVAPTGLAVGGADGMLALTGGVSVTASERSWP